MDYSQKENWLIFDDQTKQDALFDVFYVYPSLYSGNERLMPVRDSKVREKALDFAVAQTGIFHGKCRVFAPLVRQAEYKRVIESMKQEPMPVETLEEGNADTMAALQYYLKNENHGRPFVLLGHSQGSMNLYCALKEMLEISPEKGFVAAYFAGLPGITEEKIKRDFAERDIVPGKNPDDIGVILVWNTQSPHAVKSDLFPYRSFCVNPLTWRDDEERADSNLNIKTTMYRYYIKDKAERIKESTHFCGAVVDKAKGAVIVDLPEQSEYDANGALGKGIFHAVDIWLFAGNIEGNAIHRVQKYLEQK